MSPTTTPWLTCPRPSPRAILRLFCFPFSGGGPAVFYQWPDHLPPSVEVWTVLYPGRGTRLAERPYTRLQPLITDAARAMAAHLDQPFAFFGHSMGALVAFELARHLRHRYGLAPELLVLSGHGAPQLPAPGPPIHQLPEPAFIQKLRELNGTPEEVLSHDELRQLLLPVIRADFTVCETYAFEHDAPFEFPLSAYGGLADDHVGREALEAWSEHTTGPFQVRMFPGDHFYINTQRPLLLRTLAREVDTVVRRLS